MAAAAQAPAPILVHVSADGARTGVIVELDNRSDQAMCADHFLADPHYSPSLNLQLRPAGGIALKQLDPGYLPPPRYDFVIPPGRSILGSYTLDDRFEHFRNAPGIAPGRWEARVSFHFHGCGDTLPWKVAQSDWETL